MKKRKGPFDDLDMNAPLPVLTEEQKKALVDEVKKRIEAMKPKGRPRCMNGRGCPMCWGRR